MSTNAKKCNCCLRLKDLEEFPTLGARCKQCLKVVSKFNRMDDQAVMQEVQQAPPQFRADFFAENHLLCSKDLKALWTQKYTQHLTKESEDSLVGTGEWLDEIDLRKKYEYKPGYADLVIQFSYVDARGHRKNFFCATFLS